MRLIPRTLGQAPSPIGATQELLAGPRRGHEPIDLSQGVPTYPPPAQVIERVIEAARLPDTSRYPARSGLPELRELLAADVSRAYGGKVDERHVLITAGCNQAFCLVISALAAAGDEVVLPVPYYFNHDMWLHLDHLVPVHLPVGPDFLPDIETARALLTERTRALVLVTPGNPTGATIPPSVIREFAELAAERGFVLVLDETYRSFRDHAGPAHDLFADPDWQDHVVSLHSFSKELAIPGYRVGAAVGSAELLREAAKLLECVAVSAPRIAQEAAIAGLREAGGWRRERSREIAAKMRRFRSIMADAPGGFELRASGAFFGWVRHGFRDEPTEEVVRRLVREQDVAVLPGTLFMPSDERYLRFSVSAMEDHHFPELRSRLRAFGPRR